MKYLIFLLLPSITLADYGKPQLLARLGDTDSWNAPFGTWCFFNEPTLIQDQIYLPCFDGQGNFLAQWDAEGFKILARAEGDQLFSNVTEFKGKATWFEYNEFEVKRSYLLNGVLSVNELGNLTSGDRANANFRPLSDGSWFFQVKGERPELMIWKEGEVKSFFGPGAYFIFTPQTGRNGEIALKTRDIDSRESSPDKLWLYQNNEWKLLLEDRDANPASPWKSFRHQLGVDGDRVLTVAQDDQGEALVLIREGQVEVIARRGRDLKEFDFFTVKIRGNTIAFRGEDFEGRKTLYVHDEKGLRRLITEGDIVQTDKGSARIYYKSRNAIFYGAPAIGPRGEILQQVTLTDPDFPSVLIGVGLIKLQK